MVMADDPLGAHDPITVVRQEVRREEDQSTPIRGELRYQVLIY